MTLSNQTLAPLKTSSEWHSSWPRPSSGNGATNLCVRFHFGIPCSRQVDSPGTPLAVARFVEEHLRALSAPLKDLDVRKCSSALSAIANEKQRAQRDAGKKKTNPKAGAKPSLAGARTAQGRDLESYDETLDDEELDFM